MGTDADNKPTTEDEPSFRQKLHAATGDRDAEAKALADRTDDEEVDVEAAKVAVNRAHGESVEDVDTDSALASPEDAEQVAEGN